jgi:hypothetical protein
MCSCHKGQTIVSINNQSGAAIQELRLEVYGQRKIWNDINVGQSVRFTSESKGDSHYSVHVEFAGGKTLNKEIGYVTHGANFDDQIVVSSSDISLSRPKPKTGENARPEDLKKESGR